MKRSAKISETFVGVGYTRDRAGLPLEAVSVPVPRPGADQVLIRVAASSLKPLEYKQGSDAKRLDVKLQQVVTVHSSNARKPRCSRSLERLFLEERRRAKIIPHAFGERPVLKLMYAAVIRAADRWRAVTVGEFEQRQLRAIREELDRAHAERTRPAVRHIPSASPSKLSSKIRT
jgi:hypothetical protein